MKRSLAISCATLVVLALTAGGCLIDDLRAIGRPCSDKKPCGPASTCNPKSNLCIAIDDSGVPDASPVDVAADRADLALDQKITPDIFVPDVILPDGGIPTAKCSASTKLAFSEIAVGSVDYVSIINLGSATVDLKNYRVITSGGVPSKRADYVVPLSKKLVPGQLAYVFENSSGVAADLNTGRDIPFTAPGNSSASLFDPNGQLLDHVAIGAKAIDQPVGANFSPAPVTIPGSFDTTTQAYRRNTYKGRCPNYFKSDWKVGALSRK